MQSLIDFFYFLKVFSKKQSIFHLSAQLAYRFLLAFIPFIMITCSIFGLLSTEIGSEILEGFQRIFPFFMDDFVTNAVESAAYPQGSIINLVIFPFYLLYALLCAMRSVTITFDKILGSTPAFTVKDYLMSWAKAFGCLLSLLAAVIFILAMYFFTQSVSIIFFEYFDLWNTPLDLWNDLSTLYILAVIVLVSAAVYMYFPTKHLSFFEALPGSIVTVLGWAFAMLLYQIFLNSRGPVQSLFTLLEGPFAFIIVVYAFCLVLTFGCVVICFFKKGVPPYETPNLGF